MNSKTNNNALPHPYTIFKSFGKLKVCYSQIGQHSACSPDYEKESRKATPQEYSSLKKELESIGYKLKVIH